VRLTPPIVRTVAAVGLVLLAARNLQAQQFKVDVQSPQWGLRVVTDTPGGKVGLFGPIGDFVIDAPSVPGGRLTVKENGNVGIGTASPAARLHLANASNSGAGLFLEASEGDRAAMYYSPNTGVVFDSFRPGDARRLPVLLQPNGGNVGIGTAGPGKALHISTSTNSGHLAIGGANQNAMMFVNAANSTTNGFLVGRSFSSDDANTFFIYDLTANTNRLLIDAAGRVGIGTNAPSSTLSVDGGVYVTGNVCAANISCASDARLKQDVRALSYGLPEVLRLRPVSWQWKDPATTQLNLGLVAQDVESVLPELIMRDVGDKGSLGLNYTGLIPVAIKAIQEQQGQIQQQQEQLESQRRQIDALRQLVCSDHAHAAACSGTH
jgi:endosialidase-like protein